MYLRGVDLGGCGPLIRLHSKGSLLALIANIRLRSEVTDSDIIDYDSKKFYSTCTLL